MIIIRLMGGLGNQLFQYAVGRQLALQHKVPLKTDISFFQYEPGRTYKLQYYNIEAGIADENLLRKYTKMHESDSLYARLYRKIERKLLPRHKRKYFKESDYYIYEPFLLKNSSDVLLEGFWQHYKYYENLDPLILNELRLKDEYTASLPHFIEDIRQNNNAVSVHIRRGDYVSDPNRSINRLLD